MRYHYRGIKKPGSRLISLSGLYAFNINPVQQVIVDPRQDNLVVNLDQKLLLVIEDHPEFELVLSDKEKKQKPAKAEPAPKVEEVKESEAKEVEPQAKEEEPSEEAPKPKKRRGRKPKAKVQEDKVEDSDKEVEKED